MTILFGRTQEAIGTPFTPSRNPDVSGGTSPITSIESQSAIEEAYYDAVTASGNIARFCTIASFDGTGSTGRWLAFGANNPSNNNPMVFPRAGAVTELSFSCAAVATTTVTIFKNGVTTGITISTAAANSARVSGLNIVFAAGDKLSAQVTSGSSSRPTLFIFSRFT